MVDFGKKVCYDKYRKLRKGELKMEFKLTADYVGISEDGENFGLFYTLVEDESFERFIILQSVEKILG